MISMGILVIGMPDAQSPESGPRSIDLPPSLFLGSALFTTCGMLVLGNEYFRRGFRAHFWDHAPPKPLVYIFDPCDPVWPFLLSAVLVCVAVRAYRASKRPKRSVIVDVGVGVGVVVALIVIQGSFELAIKSSFDYQVETRHEPVVAGWVGQAVSARHLASVLPDSWIRSASAVMSGSAAPSGWCWKQLWLVLAACVLWEQADIRDRRGRVWTYAIGALAFLWTAYGRVELGRHSLFDVGMSLGMATYLFWTVGYLVLGAMRRIDAYTRRRWFSELAAYSVLYLLLPFYYARDPQWYVLLWGALVVAMWLVSLLGDDSRSTKQAGATSGGALLGRAELARQEDGADRSSP